jgi:ACT domain
MQPRRSPRAGCWSTPEAVVWLALLLVHESSSDWHRQPRRGEPQLGRIPSLSAPACCPSVGAQRRTALRGRSDRDADPGWRVLRVVEAHSLEVSGVTARLAAPLAEIGVPIFTRATFDTDHLLVQVDRFEEAITRLRAVGHRIADLA